MLPLQNRIQSNYQQMSNSQKRIAGYLLDNYDKAVFLTAKQLGQELALSESTVIRFAWMLGYDGYPEMQKALQEMVKNKITTVERLQHTMQENQDSLLSNVLNRDIDNIRRTLEEMNTEEFRQALELILSAKHIYIVSLRSAVSLGHFLYFYLQLILGNCRLVESTGCFFEELAAVEPDDLVIGISFARYTRQTVEGMQYAAERGAACISITDSVTSPLAHFSRHVLVAHSEHVSFLDSFVAPLSVINALIVAVGNRQAGSITGKLQGMEEIWRKYQVYHTE